MDCFRLPKKTSENQGAHGSTCFRWVLERHGFSAVVLSRVEEGGKGDLAGQIDQALVAFSHAAAGSRRVTAETRDLIWAHVEEERLQVVMPRRPLGVQTEVEPLPRPLEVLVAVGAPDEDHTGSVMAGGAARIAIAKRFAGDPTVSWVA